MKLNSFIPSFFVMHVTFRRSISRFEACPSLPFNVTLRSLGKSHDFLSTSTHGITMKKMCMIQTNPLRTVYITKQSKAQVSRVHIHSWQKRLLHPGIMCVFCDYFYFISPPGLRAGCLVQYNVFYVFDALFFYSVVFCQFWRHLMIKWVIGRMCIPKCHWKIIVVNLVEQRWFLSWRCLVVSFCVFQVNIGYSRLSRQ